MKNIYPSFLFIIILTNIVVLNTATLISKATIRDTLNRLRNLIIETDPNSKYLALDTKTDDDINDSPQKLIDKAKIKYKAIIDSIVERNKIISDKKTPSSDIARLSHDINQSIHDFKEFRTLINQLYEKASTKYAKTNKKISKKTTVTEDDTKKQNDRKRAMDNYRQILDSILIMVEHIETENANRNNNNTNPNMNANPNANVHSKLKRKTIADMLNKKHKRSSNDNGDADDGDDMRNMNPDEKREFEDAMKTLQKKKEAENKALDRIQNGVNNILNIATNIGEELDKQEQNLANLENKANDANSSLKKINKSLTKQLKNNKPMNVIINVSLFLFILAMIGYFVFEFT